MKRVFKTSKVVGGGPSTYRKWSEWAEGDLVIGKYVGSKIDNYKKPNWLIEVLDASMVDGDFAESIIGKTFGLNSAGQLDKAMSKVEEGQLVQVTYNGSSVMEKGQYAGKSAHSHSVAIVEEDTGSEEEDDVEL